MKFSKFFLNYTGVFFPFYICKYHLYCCQYRNQCCRRSYSDIFPVGIVNNIRMISINFCKYCFGRQKHYSLVTCFISDYVLFRNIINMFFQIPYKFFSCIYSFFVCQLRIIHFTIIFQRKF